ncbi:cobalamin biosynthesis protein [Arcobacter caeni]|uniref:Cobalamin biosynthesis protein CobD n=1 Tax=Arcobacter caeni TaxID=1912877 RepID=A0A363CZJ3_9BACT|nr:cobalamin biosynthesis protein [Arcobacter caeni]PUE64504.1 hypothetical protein B0174_06560 [Arcobacter caeni]
MFFEVALIAYIIDMIFSEFQRFKYFKHPIIFMGDYISWFEKRFYKNSIFRGFLLTLSLLFVVFIIVYPISFINNIFIQGVLASFTLSSKMLFDAVKDVVSNENIEDKRYKISMLVSRDTSTLSNSVER